MTSSRLRLSLIRLGSSVPVPVLARPLNRTIYRQSSVKRNTFSTIATEDITQFAPEQTRSLEGSQITKHDGLPLVQCTVRARIPTQYGVDMFLHLYKSNTDKKEHLAMVFGKSITSRSLFARQPDDTETSRMLRGANNNPPYSLTSRTPASISTTELPPGDKRPGVESTIPLVRVHSECFTGETVWSVRCDCGDQLDTAARLICQSPSPNGVIIYLRQEGRGIGLENKLRAYNLQDQGADTVEANQRLGYAVDERSYSLGTSILCDLGLGGAPGIRLLTNNPEKVAGIRGPLDQVTIREVLPMKPSLCKENGMGAILPPELMSYLQTKIHKLGHTIDLS